MNLQNARIELVMATSTKVGILFKTCWLKREYTCDLENTQDVLRLEKIVQYTEAENYRNLKGKFVRLVFKRGKVIGFGHIIDDVFVPINTPNFEEVTELEFREMLDQ